MAEAWLKNPDPDEYTEVNHKDKNRSTTNIAVLFKKTPDASKKVPSLDIFSFTLIYDP